MKKPYQDPMIRTNSTVQAKPKLRPKIGYVKERLQEPEGPYAKPNGAQFLMQLAPRLSRS